MQQIPTLKRSLSLPLVTFYGIGTILGAGIYVLVGKVAGAAGMHTPVAFLLASLLILPSAFSYAELVARFPRSAGEAIYVQEGLGWPPLSILVGLMIVSLGVLSTATLVHGLVGYLAVFFALPDTAVILAAVLVMGAVVAWGISESVMLATLMTIVEIGGLLLIIWVARDGFAVFPEHAAAMVPGIDGTVWAGVMLGAFIAFYAYIGFEDMVNVAEEVREPSRNLPLAILTAWLVTTLLYLVVSTVCVLVLSPPELAATDAPLALVYQHMTGRAPVVITAISLVSIINGALIQIIMASRVLYGMSRQGWLPELLGRVNAKTHTPLVATALVCAVILLFALWLPLVELAKLTSLITLSVFALVNLALLRVKRRHGTAPGVWRVPYWVPVVGVCCSAGFGAYQTVRMVTG
ncbi:MAG: amino acid permease [Pseudomonadota bacterium]|nr:MAG: amino acid permease [Pseudomonadota bacterium]